jgi:hypothetical protein
MSGGPEDQSQLPPESKKVSRSSMLAACAEVALAPTAVLAAAWLMLFIENYKFGIKLPLHVGVSLLIPTEILSQLAILEA